MRQGERNNAEQQNHFSDEWILNILGKLKISSATNR